MNKHQRYQYLVYKMSILYLTPTMEFIIVSVSKLGPTFSLTVILCIHHLMLLKDKFNTEGLGIYYLRYQPFFNTVCHVLQDISL
jgi:hypothetical protein